MKYRTCIVGALTLLTACGGNSGGGDDGDGDDDDQTAALTCTPRSGERLRVRWLEGGGASVEAGFHDTEHDVPCEPGLIDGEARCVPPGSYEDQITFLDAACTERIFKPTYPLHDERYHYAYTEGGESCSVTTTEASRIEDALELTPDDTIYQLAGSDCHAVPAQAATYHTLGAATSVDIFASLTQVRLELDGRVDHLVYEGEDGARLCGAMRSFEDRELDQPCEIGGDGASRCLPDTIGLPELFADAACSEQAEVAVATPSACDASAPVPDWIRKLDGPTCSSSLQMYRRGESNEATLYAEVDGTCVVAEPGADRFALGEEVPLSTFAAARSVLIEGEARLQAFHDVVEDGPVLPSRLLHDAELDTACRFYTPAPGEPRCIPTSTDELIAAPVARVSVDAACSGETALAYLWSECQAAPRYAVEYIGGGDRPRVFEVVGAHEGAVYQGGPDFGSACEPYPDTYPRFWYELGAEIEPSALVTGTYRVE